MDNSHTKNQPETAFKTSIKYQYHSPSLQNQDLIASPKKLDFRREAEFTQAYSTYAKASRYNLILNDELEKTVVAHQNEVNTLIMQITRLQDLLFESERLRKTQVQKMKDELENQNYLKLSNLRQSQFSQIEVLEAQNRKLKQQLQDKTDDYKKLEIQLNRNKDYFEKEEIRLKNQIKLLIESKHIDRFQVQRESQIKISQIEALKFNEINEIKHLCDKQISNAAKNLEETEQMLNKLRKQNQKKQQEKQKLVNELQQQKQNIERRLKQRLHQQHSKYDELRQHINRLVLQKADLQSQSAEDIRNIFNDQYDKLFTLVKLKQAQNSKLRNHIELQSLGLKDQIKNLKDQNSYLKNSLEDTHKNYLKEIQLMKIKIATLHQNDLNQLANAYQNKIKSLAQNLERADQQSYRLRSMIHEDSYKRYQMKKKYQNGISELNSKMIKMRMGLSNLQNDLKEKIQNQKSLMLMTSRSIIKQAEIKSKDNKFLQEQLRKLRQLIDLQAKQNENSEKAVQQRIIAASSELQRLSNKIVVITKQKKEIQEELITVTRQKDMQIADLKEQIKDISFQTYDNSAELKQIEYLKEQKNKKIEENIILKDKVAYFESRIKDMKAQLQRYQLENSINQEQAKKHYKVISDNNLEEFRVFYQSRIDSLEQEKTEMKKLIESKQQQITGLMKKYKQMEQGMNDALRMIKRRSELQEKVMNLGMDNNLVTNLVKLLPSRT